MEMDEIIIKNKIEKSLEIICPLYKHNLITDAYIIGSVARGEATMESDIDLVVINPDFIMGASDLPPTLPFNTYLDIISEKEMKRNQLREQIVYRLKSLGVEFKFIRRKEDYEWYQSYKDELFHIVPAFQLENLPNIRLSKDLCDSS
jgi:predicted nucleotidyltransferase